MILRRLASAVLACGLAVSAWAQVSTAPASEGATLKVCFNYGCLAEAEVSFSPAQLDEIAALLRAGDAAGEAVWAVAAEDVVEDRHGAAARNGADE